MKGRTVSPNHQKRRAEGKDKSEYKSRGIPSAGDYSHPPHGLTREEYTKEISLRSNELVRQIKSKIFNALKEAA